MNEIHETAIVSPKAELGDNIKVGPYSVIADNVVIGDGCEIGQGAGIYAYTTLGKDVKVFQSASVGNIPQDLKFAGEKTTLTVGDGCVIREFATLHRGTVETGTTTIGKKCLIMAYGHVAHDCRVGNEVILSNGAQLGGHVEFGDGVIAGGMCAIHQFCKVGRFTMIAASAKVVKDIPPFLLTTYAPVKYAGLNKIGLRRRGFTEDQIQKLKEYYGLIYGGKLNTTQAVEKLNETAGGDPLAEEILTFIRNSNRGILSR